MDTFMRTAKLAHEKKAIEKMTKERNPSGVFVAGSGSKKKRKRMLQNEPKPFLGPERMETGC